MSVALEEEKRRAALKQQLDDLSKIEFLANKISAMREKVSDLSVQENTVNSDLRDARDKAERDLQNLTRLKELFLGCLVRSKIPGFYSDDIVEMKSPSFLPEISSVGSGDLAVSSFSNWGSGGKKTFFKCCFAVAVHRLAVERNALLPTFLIIDSPMKNISERENRDQFEGFFNMLYDLSVSELKGTQFIIIDKEICPPPENYKNTFFDRHMTPNDRNIDLKDNPFPPLIRYYRGK
ncbi:MAG: hypothetical protein JXR76_14525 [Deltaproteobacteria bacterium]|nr:hypothetical protein [Deltaproteobacteria bacterium]